MWAASWSPTGSTTPRAPRTSRTSGGSSPSSSVRNAVALMSGLRLIVRSLADSLGSPTYTTLFAGDRQRLGRGLGAVEGIPQLGVAAAGGDQLVVAAVLDEAALLDDDDPRGG